MIKLNNTYMANQFKSAYESSNNREDFKRSLAYFNRMGAVYRKVFIYYVTSMREDKPYLDIDETIWEDEPKQIFDVFKLIGIDKFSISSNSDSVKRALYEFKCLGCKLVDIDYLKFRRISFDGDVYEVTPLCFILKSGSWVK